MNLLLGPGPIYWGPPGIRPGDPGWQLLGIMVCNACGDTGWLNTHPLDLGAGHQATLKDPCPFIRSPHHQRQT
jgi:hypothetical protein